jgi:hypothetical protein
VALCAALINNPVLRQVTLTRCSTNLAAALPARDTLLSLCLSDCTGVTTGLIEAALQPTLRTLSICRCPLGDKDAAAAARIVATRCPGLTCLRLEAVGGEYEMFSALLEGASQQRLSKVTEVGLAGNAPPPGLFRQLCAAWLCGAHPANGTVAQLSIGSPSLDYFSVSSVADLVRCNVHLRRLSLRGCTLSAPALAQLLAARKAVSHCSRLVIEFDEAQPGCRQLDELRALAPAL